MTDQPEYWTPTPDTLFQCTECDVLFAHPQPFYHYGDWIYACPECYNPDFSPLAYDVVFGLFWHIIAQDFNEARRMTLRAIAESQMGPHDPTNRRK